VRKRLKKKKKKKKSFKKKQNKTTKWRTTSSAQKEEIGVVEAAGAVPVLAPRFLPAPLAWSRGESSAFPSSAAAPDTSFTLVPIVASCGLLCDDSGGRGGRLGGPLSGGKLGGALIVHRRVEKLKCKE
jgi:hypothetical protein